MPYVQTLANGDLLLRLHVQPKASKGEITGVHGNALKLRLTAPPVEGKANKAVIDFLAKKLHLPKSALTIKTGLQNRHKEILITGCDEQALRQTLVGDNTSEES